MNIAADDDADATLFDHIDDDCVEALPDDEVDAAKEIARAANDYENETVAQAIKTLTADDEVHEFWGAALHHAEKGCDVIRKVLDVRFGEQPDRHEYDHRPHVKVYEVPVDGIMVYAGHVMTEAEGEEQGWVSYPLSVAEEDMARICDTLEQMGLPEAIEIKRNSVDVDVPIFDSERVSDAEVHDALLNAFQRERKATGVMRVQGFRTETKVVYNSGNPHGPQIEYFLADNHLYDENIACDYVSGTVEDVAQRTGCRIAERGWNDDSITRIVPDESVVELINTRSELEEFLNRE